MSTRLYAEFQSGHLSLGKSLRVLLMVIIGLAIFLGMFVILAVTSPSTATPEVMEAFLIKWLGFSGVLFGTAIIFIRGVRVAAQWEKGVLLRLGKYRGLKGPGILYVVPFIDSIQFVDLRLQTLNIPSQQVITKDNVPASVDGVLFFMVNDPKDAILNIQDFRFAISQYAQATLRDVVGGMSLDELLSERDKIQVRVAEIVEERIKGWGLHLDTMRIQDIEMPEDLKRIMSRQASAEREKRATITKAEGDKMAAANLAEAARIMEESHGGMRLRTLQTIDALGASSANTVVLFPIDLQEMVSSLISHKKEQESI